MSDHQNPPKLQEPKLHLKFEENSKIFKLTIDNQLYEDAEKLGVLEKFFKILESSSVEEVILNNINNDLEAEISKFIFRKSKYSLKNVIFHQNCSTKIVVWMVNKCGMELEDIYMRGLVPDAQIPDSHYIYETQLLRMKEVPLTNKIERLKSIFQSYRFSTWNFAQFLFNFAKFNPIGAKLFFETRFSRNKLKLALGALLDDEMSKEHPRGLLQELDDEKVAIFKFRPNGVICTVLLNDESIKMQCSPKRSPNLAPKFQEDPDFDYSSLSAEELQELSDNVETQVEFFDKVYHLECAKITHRFESYQENLKTLKELSDDVRGEWEIRVLETLKLKFTENSIVLIGKRKELDETIYEKQSKSELEKTEIYQNFLNLLKTVHIDELTMSSSSKIDPESEIAKKFLSLFVDGKTEKKFSVSAIHFDANCATNMIISVYSNCDKSLMGIFLRGMFQDAKDTYSNYAFSTQLTQIAHTHLATKIDRLKSVMSNFKFSKWKFSSFLENFAKFNPIGSKLFVETRIRQHKLCDALNNLLSKESLQYDPLSCACVMRLSDEKRAVIKFSLNGVYCSVEEAKSTSRFLPKVHAVETFEVALRNCRGKTKGEHIFDEYLRDDNKLYVLRMDLLGDATIWDDLPPELKMMCAAELDERSRAALSVCSRFEHGLIHWQHHHFALMELFETGPEIKIISVVGRRTHFSYSPPSSYLIELSATDSDGKKESLCRYNLNFNEKRKRNYTFGKLLSLIRLSKIEHLKIDLRSSIGFTQRLASIKTAASIGLLTIRGAFGDFLDPICLAAERIEQYYKDDGFAIASKFVARWHLGDVEIGRKVQIFYRTEKKADNLREFFHCRNALLLHLRPYLVAHTEKEGRFKTENPEKHIVLRHCQRDHFECAVVDADSPEISPICFFEDE